MDAQGNAQHGSSGDDGSAQAEDGGDALRALVDQFDAAERELRATEELRRVHAEQVARLRQEVTASVDASLETSATERTELESRLKDLEERERYLQGIKGRMTGDPASEIAATTEATTPDDADASTTVPPVSDGWVLGAKPQAAAADADADDDAADGHGDEPHASEDHAEVASDGNATPDATESGDEPSNAQQDNGGAYEDGWYEVLKQRRS